MVVISRILFRGYSGLHTTKILRHIVKENFCTVTQKSQESQNNIQKQEDQQKRKIPERYRFIYPEFLPDPNAKYRHALREKLERMDMLARRSQIGIPEFYVGSVLAVTYFEPHAPGKINKFVGICIERGGAGLRAHCLLRNVIDNQGIEVLYDLYDPAIQKIECLRLEKRLDPHLRYLRDAPAEYSTFPLDMEAEYLSEDAPVPINKIKIKLNPRPWIERWERQELKGVEDLQGLITEKQIKQAKAAETPWEKYDLMKKYRATIPEEDQNEIFNEIYTKLHDMEITRRKQQYKRTFIRPKKIG